MCAQRKCIRIFVSRYNTHTVAKTPVEERQLNIDQKKAVMFGKGPLLIIAGAGTGKTTVVTERIKHLITSGLAKPSEILALTFTEKASREMEERVDMALPYGTTQMWISTFHAFCDRILRNEGINIGLDPGFRLMTEAETILFFRKNIFKFTLNYFRPLGNPNKFIAGMMQHFSRLKDEDVNPSQYSAWVNSKSEILNPKQIQNSKSKISNEDKEETEKYRELANAYRTYEELKVKEGLVDYSDLISNTLKLFRTRKNILKRYQEQFKYILIDEFQDTNFAQNELALLLSGTRKNITVVGDDDQCLPPTAKIATPTKEVFIKDIRRGDHVLCAVGKGYLSSAKVIAVQKTKKRTRFLTFRTASGKVLEVTDNHKMFCMIPGRKFGDGFRYYVYVMWRDGMGWRMGITDDLAQRLKLERSADKIVAIRACRSLEEARFYESVYSLTYQIPTYPFKPRKRMILTGTWLKKLFSTFDTEKNVQRLAHDLGIDLRSHHYCLDGVVRGNKERIKVILSMCYRQNRTYWASGSLLKFPTVLHEVRLESSSFRIQMLLKRAKVTIIKAKKGLRVRKSFASLEEAGEFAAHLCTITGGIFEARFLVGKRNGMSRPSLVMPAKNILEGMSIPVKKGYEVIYEKVLERSERDKESDVYDLEIEHAHNFIADSVVVHNSIYRFRGSSISNIIQFRKRFSKAKIIVLTKNYRATKERLDRSYDLIQHNNPDRLEVAENIDKKLESMRRVNGDKVEVIYTDRVENEAEEVARQITRQKSPARNATHSVAGGKVKSDGSEYEWKDFAILVRANNHAEPFTRALSRAGIPFQFLGPGQLFRQPEVKDLIAYLKVLYNFQDSVAMYRVLTMDWVGIPARDVAAIVNEARKNGISIFEASERFVGLSSQKKFLDPLLAGQGGADLGKDLVVQGSSDISTVELEKRSSEFFSLTVPLEKLVRMIHRHLGLIKKETAGQILYYFLQDTGLLMQFTTYKTVKEERVAANIAKFFAKLKTYEGEHDDASVFAVVDWIDLLMNLGESPTATDMDWTENNAVNILTIHSAKGLEFPVVFLVNLVDARFPTRERHEQIPIPDPLIKEILPIGDFHLEEERRLFYVGMTRARDVLYLTAAKFYGEGKREKKLSPFIGEAIGEKQISDIRYSPRFGEAGQITDNTKQLGLLDWAKVEEQEMKLVRQPITYLSYSQLSSYTTCPLQYKYRYILKIPVPPSAALTFGDTMHRTVRAFYTLALSGERPTKDTLLGLFEKNWSSFGYGDRVYEKKMKLHGKELLDGFFEKGYDPNRLPIDLEASFKIRITPALTLGGRIDRVDEIPGGKMEIIDYKTGQSPKGRDVTKDTQLTVYALAATEEGIYHKKPEDVVVSFYFFEDQSKVSATRTREQLDQMKKDVAMKSDEISRSDFRPTPGKHCDFCEFRLICEAWQ